MHQLLSPILAVFEGYKSLYTTLGTPLYVIVFTSKHLAINMMLTV